jgi:hypothetical protein
VNKFLAHSRPLPTETRQKAPLQAISIKRLFPIQFLESVRSRQFSTWLGQN